MPPTKALLSRWFSFPQGGIWTRSQETSLNLISSSLRAFSSLSNLREAHYEARAVQFPFCLAPFRKTPHDARNLASQLCLSFLLNKNNKIKQQSLTNGKKIAKQSYNKKILSNSHSRLASAWDQMRRFGMYWTWPPLDHPTPPKGWDSSDLPGRR